MLRIWVGKIVIIIYLSCHNYWGSNICFCLPPSKYQTLKLRILPSFFKKFKTCHVPTYADWICTPTFFFAFLFGFVLYFQNDWCADWISASGKFWIFEKTVARCEIYNFEMVTKKFSATSNTISLKIYF